MRTTSLLGCVATLLLLSPGCRSSNGSAIPDGAVEDTEDGGASTDAGAIHDAGAMNDGGASIDAGSSIDGGAMTDGGSTVDAGQPPPGATKFTPSERGTFDGPWAMTFLPDGRLLVTEKKGVLKLRATDGAIITVAGVPPVEFGDQGGLGDVVLHPGFAENGWVYLSWAEGNGGHEYGAAVGRAKLVLTGGPARLENLEVIWRQVPKVTGQGHYGHRLAFGSDGLLWITSGERQKFDPAQDMTSNLGKVLRLKDDGSAPADNPFVNQGGVAAQVWSLGHRNPLGIAFDAQGKLWVHEMGPMGGDELNLIERGSNYGYPIVSNGDHYGGAPIPDHDTRPEFNAPAVSWNPVISPAGMVIYSGDLFDWRGDALIGGLSSWALIRVEFEGNTAREAQRFPMGARIREVEQGPGGTLWVLEDGANARLLELVPAD